MSLTVIYLHGFNSSPQSIKAQQLSAYYDAQLLNEAGYQLLIPQLDHQPKVAIEQLCVLVEQVTSSNVLLIGSSLGGYYSLYLAQKYPHSAAVLVNPAVYPYRLLADMLGEQQNLYTGQRYLLSAVHIEQLKALDVIELDNPARILLYSQTGDETLDYQEAVLKYPLIEQRVSADGNHSFENFESVIPQIFEFADQQFFRINSK
jgi:predicted esterase YcpF (UPF0227 family)